MPFNKRSIAQEIYTPQGFTKTGFEPLSVLHLGCGARKIPGAVGADMLPLAGVDVVHDLEQTPWPFADNQFDIIVLHAVLEHLRPMISVMEEIHRVGKPGARVVINVPYFRCVDAFTDPTHVHFFTSASLEYVLEEGGGLAEYRYTERRFKKIGFWHGWPQPSRNPLANLLKYIAARRPYWYDQYLSLLFPFKILVWELEVKK